MSCCLLPVCTPIPDFPIAWELRMPDLQPPGQQGGHHSPPKTRTPPRSREECYLGCCMAALPRACTPNLEPLTSEGCRAVTGRGRQAQPGGESQSLSHTHHAAVARSGVTEQGMLNQGRLGEGHWLCSSPAPGPKDRWEQEQGSWGSLLSTSVTPPGHFSSRPYIRGQCHGELLLCHPV